MTGPPPLPGRGPGVRPHRAQQLLLLAIVAFFFAPCGFVAVLLARRDLRAMAAAGTMDRAGERNTRFAKGLAIGASIVWMIKWAILVCAGVVVYRNWDHFRQLLP